MARAEDIFDTLVKRGMEAIDQYISDAASEELFLDFKRSADNGTGSKLAQDDRNNLGRAVSGFGNSEGGVIVWGVDCSRDPKRGDVAATKYPITQPARFKSWLEGAVSGVTVPPHSGLRHHAIPDKKSNSGFVATLIPKSNLAPHQTVSGPQYYMRAGSSFVPVPHGVLSGMFGRRPQPVLSHAVEVRYASAITTQHGPGVAVVMQLVIRNDGLGVAETVFVNGSMASIPGPKCDVVPIIQDGTLSTLYMIPGRPFCVIGHDNLKVPPYGNISVCNFAVQLLPRFEAELIVEGYYGCANGRINQFSFSVAEEALTKMWGGYKVSLADGDGDQRALQTLALEFSRAMVSQ